MNTKLAALMILAVVLAVFLSCQTSRASSSNVEARQLTHSLQVKYASHARLPHSTDTFISIQPDATISGSIGITSDAAVVIIAVLHFLRQNETIRPHIDLRRPLLLFQVFFSSIISPNAP
jgi:hypothetical protein